MIKATIQGEKKVARALKDLPVKTARRILPRTIRGGLRPMLTTAKQNAPVDTGLLKKSIRISIRRHKEGITGKVSIARKAPHAHLAHDGFTDRAGNFHAGQPFLDISFAQHKTNSLNDTNKKLGDEIEKEWRKL